MAHTTQKHEWVQPDRTKPGSVYQMDYCKHCGLIFESDLGWTSADGVDCVVREITEPGDMPERVKGYVRFHGYHFDKKELKFKKAYHEDVEYTIGDMIDLVASIPEN